MPDYKRATLQDDDGPEPAGDGSASPDSMEVRSAPTRSIPFLSILPGPSPHPQPEPACSRVGSRSRTGSQARLGCPQGCAERQPKCGRECAWATVLPCGWGVTSTHCRLAGAGALGTLGGMPCSLPRHAAPCHAAEPGTAGSGDGRVRGEVRPSVVQWQVLLLLRWGFGRGRRRW